MTSKAIGFLNFKFKADLSNFDKGMMRASKKLKRFGKSVKKAGKSLSMGLTLPIVALGGAALKTFADFEQSMLKVKAVSGATEAEFKTLTDSAKLLGSTTMFTASQVADLQFELSKLGFTPEEINKATASILALAQATSTELGEAANTVAVALNSYNLSADQSARISDIMALASSSAAIDMEKFGAALPKVAATARISGDSFETMTAKLQVLADSGMEGARMGTQLKIMYSELASKGMTWDGAMGKIQKSSNKLATAQKIFGKNAANAAIILSESTEKLNEYEDANYGAIGTSQQLAEIMDSGVAGAFRRMQSQLEGVAIDIGALLVPAFNKINGYLSSAINWFNGLGDASKSLIVTVALFAAALGPILFIFGQMTIAVSALIPVLTSLKATMMANPYLLAAAAIIGVAVAIDQMTKSTSTLINTKKALEGIEKKAADAIAPQLTNIKRLVAVYDSENTTLDDKKRALNKLKKLYPKYYKDIDESTYSTGKLKQSTEQLTMSLMKKARLLAFSEGINKITADIVQLELTGKSTDLSWMEEISGSRNTIYGNWMRGNINEETESDLIKAKKMLALYTKEFETLSAELGEDVLPEIKRVTHYTSDLDEEIEDLTDDVDKLAKTDFELFGVPSIDAVKDYFTQSKNLEKENLLSGVIDQKEFDKRMFQDKISHLEQVKSIYEQFGESTTKIDEEILDAKLAGYHKEEKALKKVKNKSQELLEIIKDRIKKVFGENADLGDLSKNLQKMLDGALGIFDAFNKKMRIKAENEKKIKADALDEEYERQKAAIENSGRSEEQKAKMMEDLDKKTQAARTALEEETEKKLAKIKKREAMRNKAMAIVDAIINTATAVTKVLGQAGLFGIPMAAIVGAMGAIQIGIIASTPLPLAEGGIISGPTQALIGEYPGAGSNPEVVAPLDKLKSMIGGGNQHITVSGKLIGNDIFLSNSITGVNRQRTT
jgi:hypothetical protein